MRDAAAGSGRHRPVQESAHLWLFKAEAEHDTFAVALAHHHVLTLKHLKMACGAGLGQPDVVREVADATFAPLEAAHQLEPGWIAQARHQAAHARLGIDHCIEMHNMSGD